jgi:hypothetical protein
LIGARNFRLDGPRRSKESLRGATEVGGAILIIDAKNDRAGSGVPAMPLIQLPVERGVSTPPLNHRTALAGAFLGSHPTLRCVDLRSGTMSGVLSPRARLRRQPHRKFWRYRFRGSGARVSGEIRLDWHHRKSIDAAAIVLCAA